MLPAWPNARRVFRSLAIPQALDVSLGSNKHGAVCTLHSSQAFHGATRTLAIRRHIKTLPYILTQYCGDKAQVCQPRLRKRRLSTPSGTASTPPDISKLIMFCDGSARPNPGVGGAGVLLVDDCGQIVHVIADHISPLVSNNEAEYHALIRGLQSAHRLGARQLQVFLDSQLVCNQMKGEYEVKAANLKRLVGKAKKIAAQFDKVRYIYISREKNSIANDLANLGRMGGPSGEMMETQLPLIIEKARKSHPLIDIDRFMIAEALEFD